MTKGDLTRSIQVQAQGEVALVKDNINEMIGNLRDTTSRNEEQDWLKTNLAKFTRMLQGQRDLLTVGEMILSELAPLVSAQQGVFYVVEAQKEEGPETTEHSGSEAYLKLLASYAFRSRKNVGNRFALGGSVTGVGALNLNVQTTVSRDDLTGSFSNFGGVLNFIQSIRALFDRDRVSVSENFYQLCLPGCENVLAAWRSIASTPSRAVRASSRARMDWPPTRST